MSACFLARVKQFMKSGLASIIFSAQATALVTQMPADFVSLSSIAPGIIQSQRYAGSENFLGRPVPGYSHTGSKG